jgi:hypothetical protein
MGQEVGVGGGTGGFGRVSKNGDSAGIRGGLGVVEK